MRRPRHSRSDGSRIDRLQADWDSLARHDALHAVLSDPARADGGWNPTEFYANGRDAVARMFEILEENDIRFERRRALDFGCGVGRLSFALAGHFDRVTGVDVSSVMLDKARAAGVPPNCELVLQTGPALPAIDRGGYDLVVSVLVLQHMHPRLARAYLRTLPELLTPGGVLFFQLPHGYARTTDAPPRSAARAFIRKLAPPPIIQLRRWAALRRGEARRRRAGLPTFDLHHVRISAVRRILTSAGVEATVLARDDPGTAAPLSSAWYVARRAERPVSGPRERPGARGSRP